MSSVSSVVVYKKNQENQLIEELDLLAVEEPMEIRLGFGERENREQKSISVTMRTPNNDFELAMGFLFSEGIIHDLSEIHTIRYCTDLGRQSAAQNIVRVELTENVTIDLSKLERNFYATSSCGVCGKASIDAVTHLNTCPILPKNIFFTSEIISTFSEKMRTAQAVFEHTGGLHAAALFDASGNLILLREDIGRHNALDKLIGASFQKKILPLHDYLLFLSGRISFELVQKAAMAGIPIIAAIGSPSSLAVQTAEAFGITLIGFVRGNRFNIYTSKERIV